MMLLIDKIYDKLFKAHRATDEFDYWQNFFRAKLDRYNKDNVTDLEDEGEVFYYERLLSFLQVFLDIQSFAGLNILELGSGSGLLSLMMAKRGAYVTLFDSSDLALEYSRIIWEKMDKPAIFSENVRFVKGDLFKLNSSEKFDLVHNYGVIEHFEDNAIRDIINIMKKQANVGGLVVSAVPNYFSPDMIGIWMKYGKGSERYISRCKLIRLMKDCGLVSTRVITSTSVFPYNPLKKHLGIIENLLGQYLYLGFLHIVVGQKK